MGWHEGQSGGEGKLPSMICFLLRPLSVSALQQKREKKSTMGICTCMCQTHTCTCMCRHGYGIQIRSFNVPNNCLHSTNKCQQITEENSTHSAISACVCGSGTDRAALHVTALLLPLQSTTSLPKLDDVLVQTVPKILILNLSNLWFSLFLMFQINLKWN